MEIKKKRLTWVMWVASFFDENEKPVRVIGRALWRGVGETTRARRPGRPSRTPVRGAAPGPASSLG